MTKKKYLILLLAFSSCSSIDFSYFQSIYDSLSRNNIDITESYIKSAPYSFIKVSNSKNDAIFVLSSISENGVYTWIGSNYEVIKTLDGLIIETQGLESDIKLYPPQLKSLDSLITFSTFMDLSNPELIYEKIQFNRISSELLITEQGNMQVLIIERRSPNIGWKSKDKFIFKDGSVYKTIQEIHPFRDRLEITFYLK
tara:strand:- start:293 stop:886 length:594 start_codon:yes stop_codon:yes gene_type:complete